jgi:predicted nucleic acid-binding Zn ribbon protein
MMDMNKVIGKRNCPFCGKEFEYNYTTTTKIYCSEKCKHKLNRERERQLEKDRYLKKRLS